MKSINFIGNVNILDGKITYDDFDIDENTPFSDQVYSLQEDMLQIKYGKRFVLDVGWRQSFDPNGCFIVVVILDRDWMNPVFEGKCRSIPELKKMIESAAALIHEQLKIKNLPYREVEYEEFDYPREE